MMTFGRRRQKAIAPFILALWLFAIFVSVAHACGLDQHDNERSGVVGQPDRAAALTGAANA